MKFTDVLNMSAADLKANRKDVDAVIKEAKKEELDTRFVSTLLDAKMRDEKLAEQGQTIKDYQEQCQEQKARIAELEKALTKSNTALEKVNNDVKAHTDKTEKSLGELRKELDNQSKRATKAEAKSKARRKALADLAAIINPLLAEEDNS